MENNRALECINEITDLISKYNFDFPKPKDKVIKAEKSDEPNYLSILKRVRGILVNPTEENAMRKIENVNKLLSNFTERN